MDLGYKWVEHQEKATKLHPLTPLQKKTNREKARKRIIVEHTNRRVKTFRIFGSIYRNKGRRFTLRMHLVCGILNHEKWFKTSLARELQEL
jgi:putative transposase